jgi:uncharacterized protein with von Willebrand factor type A (vWA) domain
MNSFSKNVMAQGEKIVNNLQESKIKEADLKKTNAELNDQLEVDKVKSIQKLTYMNEFFFKSMKKRGDQLVRESEKIVNNLKESRIKEADLKKTNTELNDQLEVDKVKSTQKLTYMNEFFFKGYEETR